jgi:hypothetical protein
MRFSSQVSSLLLFWGLAFSAEAADPEKVPAPNSVDVPEEPAQEEMIVIGQMRVATTRERVVTKLKRMGYHPVKRDNGRTIIRHRAAYKPTVILDDDGWIMLKRSPIKIDPPGKKRNKLRYLWCLPPFTLTPACIRPGGQLIHPKKLSSEKGRIVARIKPYLREWQDAVGTHAMGSRLSEGIPDLLDAIWERGSQEEEDGPFLKSPAARRAAIFSFWAGRSCVDEGQKARNLAADFILNTIQYSTSPATHKEIAAANAAQRCPDVPLLPTPPDH